MTDETVFAGAAPRRIGPGTRLNDLYEIDALVATGGMGEVYRGHAIETGDVVAIKTIKPEFAGSGPALALFRKEASALHNLYHEAIIRYYVFSIDKPLGLPYLAMEFVSGEALSDIAARGPLPPDAIDTLRRRLASGLAAAHDLGIIHRDVSPDNVILPGGNAARAKIIDFGIARSSLGGATVIGDGFAGKYGYVSPEQLGLFGGEVTPRSDIYSLGLVLAEAALGRRLDMGQNPVDVVEKRRTVPDLTGIDARQRPLLEAMLQPDPASRIASMEEIAAWGGAVQTAVPIMATSAPIKPKPPARPAHGGRSRVPLIAAAIVIVLAVAGGGGYWALQGNDADRRQLAATDPGSRLEEQAPPAPIPVPSRSNPAPPVAAPPPSSNGPVPPASSSTATRTEPPVTRPEPPARMEPPASRADNPAPRTDPPAPTPAAPTIASPTPASRVGTNQSSARPDPVPATPNTTPAPLPAPAQAPPQPTPPPGGTPGTMAAIVPPPPAGRTTSLEQVADYIRDYRGGECLYLGPVAVGAREASIEAYGADAPTVSTFDSAFTSAFGFDPQIQLRLVTAAQCGVVDALARQGVQRRQRLPKLTLARDRLRSGDELAGTLDLPEDGNAELLLVDDEGEVHSLARNAKRNGRRVSFSVRLQASGTAKPQLVVGVTSSEPLGFLKIGRGTQAADLFRVVTDEVAQPNAPVGVAVRYLRLGE